MQDIDFGLNTSYRLLASYEVCTNKGLFLSAVFTTITRIQDVNVVCRINLVLLVLTRLC